MSLCVGPAIVDENARDGTEGITPGDLEVEPDARLSASASPSLSEAEEQAVQILESAIESAVETVSSKSGQEGEEADVTLTGTSVILSPEKEFDETDSQIVDEEAPQGEYFYIEPVVAKLYFAELAFKS